MKLKIVKKFFLDLKIRSLQFETTEGFVQLRARFMSNHSPASKLWPGKCFEKLGFDIFRNEINLPPRQIGFIELSLSGPTHFILSGGISGIYL